jgi:hypothetical protein
MVQHNAGDVVRRMRARQEAVPREMEAAQKEIAQLEVDPDDPGSVEALRKKVLEIRRHALQRALKKP